MSDDIYNIIQRLAIIEGKSNLSPGQKSAGQLPALFKPTSISPVLTSKTDKKNPLGGKLVGSLEETMQSVEEDMLGKVKKSFADYLEKLEKEDHLDPHLVRKAKHDLEISDDEEVDENAEELSIGDPVVITGRGIEFEGKTGDIDSFGDMKRFVVVNLYNHGKHSFHSSDVSYNDYADQEDVEEAEWDHDVQPDTGPSDAADSEVAHGAEDQVATAVSQPTAPLGESPVKTYTMEDGTCLECYGDETQGFELRNGERRLPTRFPRMDHADMAVKLFQRRKQAAQQQDQDYIEER
jgi:hypothetical protein